MNHVIAAKDILDTMLGYLGFVVEIEVDTSRPEPCLQVFTQEGDYLIGRHGDRLDDIQYLVNRILQNRDDSAPRIRVDINHYRSMSEDKLIQECESLAARVVNNEKAASTKPLNSYHRRIVHNHFAGHEKVETSSPKDHERFKRITISLKAKKDA